MKKTLSIIILLSAVSCRTCMPDPALALSVHQMYRHAEKLNHGKPYTGFFVSRDSSSAVYIPKQGSVRVYTRVCEHFIYVP